MSETVANKSRRRKAKTVAKIPKAIDVTKNRVAKITFNKGSKRYDYGTDNLLPNQLLKAVEASVTAASCRSKKQEFIEGRGLKDTDLGDAYINPTQTIDDLVMELADVVGLFDGIALAVKYNTTGQPEHVFAVPFELVRKDAEGQYYMNEGLAENKDVKKDRVYYGAFDPNEAPSSRMQRVSAQIEEYKYQVGDILYMYGKKSGQKHYPIPVVWAGMEEIESDAALARLDWRNVKKGFRPDAIISKQPEDDEIDDETGTSAADDFDKTLEKFTGEGAASVMVIEVEDMQQAPKVDTFSQEKVLNSTTEATDRIGKRVCRAMEVPHVLVPGFAQAGQLGNTQEMVNTIALLNNTIARKQRMISRGLHMVFPDLDFTIEPLNLIDELPDWLLDEMTSDEKRTLGGLEASEDLETTTADKLSALSPLVATKVLEEMSSEEIRDLISLQGEKPAEQVETPTPEA